MTGNEARMARLRALRVFRGRVRAKKTITRIRLAMGWIKNRTAGLVFWGK
jgi:hypothetical protein